MENKLCMLFRKAGSALAMTAMAMSAHAIKFNVVDLGNTSSVTALNNKGQAVGATGPMSSRVAALWDTKGTKTDLGTINGQIANGVTSINDQGSALAYWLESVVYGHYQTYVTHPLLWSAATGLQEPPSGVPVISANRINNAGQLIGTSVDSVTSSTRPFVWTPDVGTTFLRPDADLGINPASADFNNKGEVVGVSATSSTSPLRTGFFWSAQAGYKLIKSSDKTFNEITLNTINDVGQAVGYIEDFAGGRIKPIIWTASKGVKVIPLWSYSARINPLSINNKGAIVGIKSPTAQTILAFYWSPLTGLKELNALLVKPKSTDVINVVSPVAINDLGQIAANGTINGEAHAMLLIPAP